MLFVVRWCGVRRLDSWIYHTLRPSVSCGLDEDGANLGAARSKVPEPRFARWCMVHRHHTMASLVAGIVDSGSSWCSRVATPWPPMRCRTTEVMVVECFCVWVVGGYCGGASETLASFLPVSTTVTPLGCLFSSWRCCEG
jgi:hypothetical protein